MIKYLINDIRPHENEIRKLFYEQPFDRYLSDIRINKSAAVEYEWNLLNKYLTNGTIVIAVEDNTKVVGLLGFHFSEWDTYVFKNRLAYLKYFILKEDEGTLELEVSNNLLNVFHEWVKDNRIQVVISKLDTRYFGPVITLQQNGYLFFECITYKSLYDFQSYNALEQGISYRFADKMDAQKLKKLSLNNTFAKSHFYLDTNFKTERVNLMYSKWIENAVKTKQKILVIEEDNEIAGAFIFEIVDYRSSLGKKFGVWKSAFVDKKFRNRKIGLKLFFATLGCCINEGVDVVDTDLVDKNIISQSFHDKLGFRLVYTKYTFHKWFYQ